ncbi:cytidine deaminase [Roseovarius aestuariivivens]|uniref:cytidine deaminase n=1 Tax=Roseovarius aestuariivivens TaxID=1888910 RepID=UPI00108058F8|nr:cytidine deaminase [Roseovarius aestuariivivens]
MTQDDENELLAQARAVRENAYAPYSGYAVGAALRGATGMVYVGCNVENAAFPEGTCAEAGALAAMIAAGETRLTAVGVVGGDTRPAAPCGGCRQKLVEFGAGEVPVAIAALDGTIERTTLAELLPGAFGPSHLGVADR